MSGLSFECTNGGWPACQKAKWHLGSARLDRAPKPIACAGVAQLVRALVCGTRGRWFKSTRLYQKNQTLRKRRQTDFSSGVTFRHGTPRSPCLCSPFGMSGFLSKRADKGGYGCFVRLCQ